MKRNVMRTIKLIALVLPVVMLMAFTSYGALGGERETLAIRQFYLEEPDSLDVVVLGASEVFAGYAPGIAYDKYGITSYGYAISSNHIQLFQSQLEEISRTQSPSLIVVDLNGALYQDTPTAADSVLRMYVEGMPLTRNKIDTIRQFGDQEHLLSYYIPFITYHGEMNAAAHVSRVISQAMIDLRGYSLLKGEVSYVDDPVVGDLRDVKNDDSTVPLSGGIEENLVDFLEYCRENNYENIVFTQFPHLITEEYAYHRLKIANSIEPIIRAYGYDVLNFDKQLEEIGLDPYMDFYNTEHMNVRGQRKFTEYFADILVNDYGVQPRELSEKSRENWEESAMYTKLFYAFFEEMKQNENWDQMLWETWKIKGKLDDLKTGME